MEKTNKFFLLDGGFSLSDTDTQRIPIQKSVSCTKTCFPNGDTYSTWENEKFANEKLPIIQIFGKAEKVGRSDN